MRRPVFIARSALLCARGTSPSAVAGALWDGECDAGQRKAGTRSFPYFGLPVDDTDWMRRAERAVRQIASQLGDLPPGTPLFVASSSFQIGHFEQVGPPFDLPPAAASFSRDIGRWLALDGARYSFSNACISSFSALEAARSLIAAGLFDEAVVLGFELANDSTLAGFAAMELLSRTTSRPFDARRDGMVLGEAVAAVRLSARAATWRIAGLCTGLDGHSTTGPDPDGCRIAEVAGISLADADLKAADIELVKLQASGSPGTDLAEANALHSIFGRHMPPLLSLKSALGHTLGASGMSELVTLLACLDADRIPATSGFARLDPEIALNPMVERSTAHVERALLNLIGFGGGLASLVVERKG